MNPPQRWQRNEEGWNKTYSAYATQFRDLTVDLLMDDRAVPDDVYFTGPGSWPHHCQPFGGDGEVSGPFHDSVFCIGGR